MQSTWAQRDLPVLNAIVELVEESDPPYFFPLSRLASASGLDLDSVRRATSALEDTYIKVHKLQSGNGVYTYHVVGVTPEARRTVGQWPTADQIARRLVAELELEAAQSQDPEKGSKLQRLADAAKSVGVEVVAAVIAKTLTGS